MRGRMLSNEVFARFLDITFMQKPELSLLA
jgi:hypothetical protein